jgi:tRNA (guanine-N7-)-methyltransferase
MRARQHVNPLGLSFDTFRGEAPRLIPGRPIEVEIGCAEAQFLFERAAIDPDRVYLGFEVRDHLVDEVNEQAAELGVPVQAIFANANKHLRSLLPAASVARLFLNFPDPWFKNRHRKRRMIDAELVDAIAQVAEPGADILVQSDVWHVALEAMDLFERRDDVFENMAGSWSFWRQGNPFGARSWREAHCIADGLPIWRIRYKRSSSSAQG